MSDEPDRKPKSPMRRCSRKVGGVLAVAAGVVLIMLERTAALGGAGQGAAWFWIVVAILLIGLGMAQLLDPRP